MNGTIKKNTYFVSIGQISQMILALILVPFATRYLGAEGFGIYALASTIMFFVLLLNDLGINTYVIREVSKNKKNAGIYYSNALFLKLALIVIDLPILLLILKICNFTSQTNLIILIFAIYGVATSITQLNTGIFRAYEKMSYETTVIVLEKVITTGAGIFVLIKGWGLFALCWVFVLGGLISILMSTVLVKKHFCEVKLSFDIDVIKHLIATSIPFGVSLFLANLYNNIGIILLSIMQPAQVVGWFSAASRLLKFTNVIPTILAIAIFPALSRESLQSKGALADLFTKGFKYICFLAIPVIAGIIILSEDIATIMFGGEFSSSIVVLRILAWAAGLIFFNIFLAGLFNASNNQKQLVGIQIGAMALNIALNMILIPKYAHIGAAIAMVVTEGMIFIVCLIYAYQKIARLQELGFVFKTIAATLVMSIIALLLKNINVFVVVAISTTIYFFALFILKGFFLEEILVLKKDK